MSLGLLVITNGRWDLLRRTLAAAREHLDMDRFDERILVNDSGQLIPVDWAPEFVIVNHSCREGLAQAIRTGWDHCSADFTLHLEDDCILGPIDVAEWLAPFEASSSLLAQVCLQRGPQADFELRDGGIIRHYRAQGYGLERCERDGVVWTEHRRLFSLQPNIYPRWVRQIGWPEHGGEMQFTTKLVIETERAVQFAFLGDEDTVPHYEHAGFCRRTPDWKL